MSRGHWKQKSPKSSHISERHFRRRLAERYGLSITPEEYHQLAHDIQNGRGRMLFRESLTRTHWLLRFKETAIRVVYDKTVKALATALPLNTAERDSLPIDGQRVPVFGQAEHALASAIEARSDATGTGAAEGESATSEAGDAR